MQVRANRSTERKAVNAARSLFEENNCIFQEVDLGNDYGKDAYVDLTINHRVTGLCFAVQIKGGKSYKHSNEYRFPLDEKHAEIWKESMLPVIGLVYDEIDGKIRWCNVTRFLNQLTMRMPNYIPINPTNILDKESIFNELKPELEHLSSLTHAHPIAGLVSKNEHDKIGALFDCFALGRHDARNFIVMRHLLKTFEGLSLRVAISILSHFGLHPDIFWTPQNWIPTSVNREMKEHLVWETAEIIHLLSSCEWQEWSRGNLGQSVYVLLVEDPQIETKMEQAALSAIDLGSQKEAAFAFVLSVYWAGEKGKEKFDYLVSLSPKFQTLELVERVGETIEETGYISIF